MTIIPHGPGHNSGRRQGNDLVGMRGQSEGGSQFSRVDLLPAWADSGDPPGQPLPGPTPLYPVLRHICRRVRSLGRSQFLQAQPRFSTKSLCADCSVSPGVKSLETGSQAETHFPELSRSWMEARDPSSLAECRSLGLCVCFWPILITSNSKEDHGFLLPS